MNRPRAISDVPEQAVAPEDKNPSAPKAAEMPNAGAPKADENVVDKGISNVGNNEVNTLSVPREVLEKPAAELSAAEPEEPTVKLKAAVADENPAGTPPPPPTAAEPAPSAPTEMLPPSPPVAEIAKSAPAREPAPIETLPPSPPPPPPNPEAAPSIPSGLTAELLAACRVALNNLRHDGATMISENSLQGMLARTGKSNVPYADRTRILNELEKEGLVGPVNAQTGWRPILGAQATAETPEKQAGIGKFLETIEDVFVRHPDKAAEPSVEIKDPVEGNNNLPKDIVNGQQNAAVLTPPVTNLAEPPAPPPPPLKAPDAEKAGEKAVINEPEPAAATVPPESSEPSAASQLDEVIPEHDPNTIESLANPWEKLAQKIEGSITSRRTDIEAKNTENPNIARASKSLQHLAILGIISGNTSTPTQIDHLPADSYAVGAAAAAAATQTQKDFPMSIAPGLQRIGPTPAVPELPQGELTVDDASQDVMQGPQDAAGHTIEGEHLGYQFPTLMETGAGQRVWDISVDWAKNVTDDSSAQIVLGDAISKAIVERNPTVDFKNLPAGTEINTSFLNSPEVQQKLAQAMEHWKSLSDQEKATVLANYLKAKNN
ncbi:MAG: hypothetical protein ACREGH_00690 [Minisyncoccia bacterium]